MGRSSLGVLAGILLVILFSLLAGWTTYIPSEIALWLPLIGFLSGCAVIGLVSRLRTAHTILVSFVVFISTVILLTFINMSWMGVFLGPIDLGAIYNAWIAFQTAVFSFIPLLYNFLDFATTLSNFATETLVQNIIYNLVAFSFFGIMGLSISGIAAYATRPPGIHVVTAPEITPGVPSPEIQSMAPPSTPSSMEMSAPPFASESQMSPSSDRTAPPSVSAPPPPSVQEVSSPPSMPTPKPVEESLPKGSTPSAQAIRTLKGKVKKHLKSSGHSVPTGQTRCPHCNATIIRGSRFCNACQREFS